MIKTHRNKLIRINKGHYNDWTKKYKEIQMVQTHRERKIAEDSLKRQQKSKEICLAIEKITKKGSKEDKNSKIQSKQKVSETQTENLRKIIADKLEKFASSLN